MCFKGDHLQGHEEALISANVRWVCGNVRKTPPYAHAHRNVCVYARGVDLWKLPRIAIQFEKISRLVVTHSPSSVNGASFRQNTIPVIHNWLDLQLEKSATAREKKTHPQYINKLVKRMAGDAEIRGRPARLAGKFASAHRHDVTSDVTCFTDSLRQRLWRC